MEDQLLMVLTLENKEQRQLIIPIGHDLEKFSESVMFVLDELQHDIVAVKNYHVPFEQLTQDQKDEVIEKIDRLND